METSRVFKRRESSPETSMAWAIRLLDFGTALRASAAASRVTRKDWSLMACKCASKFALKSADKSAESGFPESRMAPLPPMA